MSNKYTVNIENDHKSTLIKLSFLESILKIGRISTNVIGLSTKLNDNTLK